MRLTNSVAAIVSFVPVGIVEGASDVTFAADRTLLSASLTPNVAEEGRLRSRSPRGLVSPLDFFGFLGIRDGNSGFKIASVPVFDFPTSALQEGSVLIISPEPIFSKIKYTVRIV